jgi:hypothetical protein
MHAVILVLWDTLIRIGRRLAKWAIHCRWLATACRSLRHPRSMVVRTKYALASFPCIPGGPVVYDITSACTQNSSEGQSNLPDRSRSI